MKPLFIQAPSKLKYKDWGFTPNKLYYIEEITKIQDQLKGRVITVRNDYGNLVEVFEKKSLDIEGQDFEVIKLSHFLVPIVFFVIVIVSFLIYAL